MRGLKGVFFSTTNDSANYREAAAPCKPAVKAASVPRLPRFQRFTRVGSFLLLRENVVRSFVYPGLRRDGQNIRQRIGSRSVSSHHVCYSFIVRA